MYKCRTCHHVFEQTKTLLGNKGCPNCGSHDLNRRDKTISVSEKDAKAPPFELEMYPEKSQPIIQVCPYCSTEHQFTCSMDIFKCSCGKTVKMSDFQTIQAKEGKIYFLNQKQIIEESNFEKIGKEIGQLLNKKNKDYGNAFIDVAEFMKLMFPQGIPPDKYIHALVLTRIFDKMKRIVNVKKEEDVENPYEDIAGYGILMSSIWKIKCSELD